MKKLLLIISTSILTGSVFAQTYKVGDLYDVNGLKGIVVDVDASGEHGLIMSMAAGEKLKWCTNKKLDNSTSAFYEDDGQKNMEAIDKFISDGEATPEEFPLFTWAKSLGEGWYIASKDETEKIWVNMNGGCDSYKVPSTTLEPLNNPINKFDKAQRELGGAHLVDTRFKVGTRAPYYWFTSTESDGGSVLVMSYVNSLNAKDVLLTGFKATKMGVVPLKKHFSNSSYMTRAIHKF